MTVPLVVSGTDDQVRLWLTLAYDEAIAEEAMLVPSETRSQLYGSVVSSGPAGEFIEEFWTRVREIQLTPEGFQTPEGAVVLALVKAIGEKAWSSAGIAESVRLWMLRTDYIQLNKHFYTLSEHCLKMRRIEFSSGLRISFWILTGQYLFPPEIKEAVAPCIPNLIKVLELLDFGAEQLKQLRVNLQP